MKTAQSALRLESSVRPEEHMKSLAPRTATREAAECRLLPGLKFGKPVTEREGKNGYICHNAHRHIGMQPCDLASDSGGVSRSDTWTFQFMSLKRMSMLSFPFSPSLLAGAGSYAGPELKRAC